MSQQQQQQSRQLGLLRNVSLRTHWGCRGLRNGFITTVHNNELAYSIGSKISMLDNSENRSYVFAQPPEVHSVDVIGVSPDRKYLGSVVTVGNVNRNTAVIIVHNISAQISSNSDDSARKYNRIQYDLNNLHLRDSDIKLTYLSFSHDDSSLIACATSAISGGVLIFDRAREILVQRVEIVDSLVHQVTFNPLDSSRICTVGSNNLYQYWRFTTKSFFAAPINGLLSGDHTYSTHSWLPDNRLIAGTTSGFLSLVQGCDQINQVQYVFGTPQQADRVVTGLSNMVVKDDIVLVTSEFNHFALFQVKPVAMTGGHVSANLILLNRLMITGSEGVGLNIRAIQWQYPIGTSNYDLFIATDKCISSINLKMDEHRRKLGGPPSLKETLKAPIEFIETRMEKPIQSFHRGGIKSLSLAGRNSNLISLSLEEEAMAVWDINNTTGQAEFTESFVGRPDDMPYNIDIHPSGNFAAFACEDDVKECAITDIRFKVVRKIPTKLPFTFGPKDQPFVNQAHVSLVKYSHGGHLLAVITGKLGQIFSTYNYSYAPSDFKVSARREMVMNDHSATINDVTFSKDDSYIFTCANDGSVYSWKVFENRRDGEYISKGLVASKVVVGLSTLDYPIIAYIESEHTAQMMTRRTSSRNVRSGSAIHQSNEEAHQQQPGSAKGTPGRRGSVVGMNKVQTPIDQGFDFHSTMGGKSKHLLAVWYGNVSSTPHIINLDTPVTAITLGSIDGIESQDVCVLGLSDGRILISLLPFPVRIIQDTSIGVLPSSQSIATDDSNQFNVDDTKSQQQTLEHLNETACKSVQLHASSSQSVVISKTGLWIFSAGLDGSIFMLGTSSRAKEMMNIPEHTQAPECSIILTDKSRFKTIRERVEEVDILIEDTKKGCDRLINKQNEQHKQTMDELANRMKLEIKKRDDIIINGREDQARVIKRLNDEMAANKSVAQKDLSELELRYERKLANESLYLEKMRQAYDEFIVHSRLDLEDFKKKAEIKERSIYGEKYTAMQEAEDQKHLVLRYIDYVNDRHSEVLNSLEDAQNKERMNASKAMDDLKIQLTDAQRKNLEDGARANGEYQKLQLQIASKEDELLKLRGDLDWAKGRIMQLENTLQDASTELKKRTDAYEKWEYKAGDQQQQILELERIRKALTSQLHALRQEIAPKEEKLLQMSERVNEVDREYEVSLLALSEKEQKLSVNSSNLQLLQKQVRELRHTAARKDGALRRAAKLLDEYKHALQQAYFNRTKRTVPVFVDAEETVDGVKVKRKVQSGDNELIEIIAKNEGMEMALSNLSKVLVQYLSTSTDGPDYDPMNEVVDAVQERERHISQLHKNVMGLKTNLESTAAVAQASVKNYIHDNVLLLKELNACRHEIRQLSIENQRLKAKAEFADLQKNNSRPVSPDRNSWEKKPPFTEAYDKRRSQKGDSSKSKVDRSQNQYPDFNDSQIESVRKETDADAKINALFQLNDDFLKDKDLSSRNRAPSLTSLESSAANSVAQNILDHYKQKLIDDPKRNTITSSDKSSSKDKPSVTTPSSKTLPLKLNAAYISLPSLPKHKQL